MYISPTNPDIPRIFYDARLEKWKLNIYRHPKTGGRYILWVQAWQLVLKLNRVLDSNALRQAIRNTDRPQDSGKASLPTTPSRTQPLVHQTQEEGGRL